MHFTWQVLERLGILVIGIALVIYLSVLSDDLRNARYEVINNRIVDCRVLESLGQEFYDDAPCKDPRVAEALLRLDTTPLTIQGGSCPNER